MAIQRTSVGIDIGSHAIKAVQLRITEKGAFIRNALYFDRDDLAARGVDAGDRAAMAALLKTQMSEAGMPTSGVVVGISGADSILRYTSVPPVPAWRLKVIMDYEVGEVAEKVGESLASDYRVLPLPRELDDEQVVLVGLAKEERLAELLADMEGAGITVSRAVPAPLALFSAFEAFGPKSNPENPDDDVAIVVDIGRSNLSSVIVLNDRIVFARSVSFGGESFTEALAKDLGVPRDRAEEIKIKSGTVDLAAATSKSAETIVNSLRGSAAQLQNLIQSSLRFCRTQVGVSLPEPTRIHLVGGGARLRGLSTYLEKSFRRPVDVFHPHGVVATGKLEGEAANVFGTAPGDFSVPLGLAVSGVRESGFTMNILPGSYVERRRFRERTVFLYAAGVFLALNLVCALFGAWRLNAAAGARHDELRSKTTELQGMEAEMLANAQQNRETRERINRVLREVEVTSFQSFVLDFIRANMEPEIKLNRVNMRAILDEWETDFIYSLVLEGTADDSNQKGVELLEALRETLGAQERVGQVELRKVEAVGTSYEFEMEVFPAFEMY